MEPTQTTQQRRTRLGILLQALRAAGADSFLVNVLLLHIHPYPKLRGLLALTLAGNEARTGQFDMDVLLVNGERRAWPYLETWTLRDGKPERTGCTCGEGSGIKQAHGTGCPCRDEDTTGGHEPDYLTHDAVTEYLAAHTIGQALACACIAIVLLFGPALRPLAAQDIPAGPVYTVAAGPHIVSAPLSRDQAIRAALSDHLRPALRMPLISPPAWVPADLSANPLFHPTAAQLRAMSPGGDDPVTGRR